MCERPCEDGMTKNGKKGPSGYIQFQQKELLYDIHCDIVRQMQQTKLLCHFLGTWLRGGVSLSQLPSLQNLLCTKYL